MLAAVGGSGWGFRLWRASWRGAQAGAVIVLVGGCLAFLLPVWYFSFFYSRSSPHSGATLLGVHAERRRRILRVRGMPPPRGLPPLAGQHHAIRQGCAGWGRPEEGGRRPSAGLNRRFPVPPPARVPPGLLLRAPILAPPLPPSPPAGVVSPPLPQPPRSLRAPPSVERRRRRQHRHRPAAVISKEQHPALGTRTGCLFLTPLAFLICRR